MIGIVVVSHSHALAHAAVGLASEMVAEGQRPAIAVAAGLDETTLGTDATAVADAITQVDSPDGVLVFLDLGSAVLSGEMAVEFVDPELAERVRLTAAPFVEGLVAAVVTAATGAPLDVVEREAMSGLLGKQSHLESEAPEVAVTAATDAPADATFTHVLTNPAGLHARPAAGVVSALAAFDAVVTMRNTTRGTGPASAGSVVQLATLDLRQGDELVAEARGPQAEQAIAKLRELAADQFGDRDDAPDATAEPIDAPGVEPSDAAAPALAEPVTARAWPLPLPPQLAFYRAGDPDQETERLADATAVVSGFLDALRAHTDDRVADTVAAIAKAQRAILTDPSLGKGMRKAIAAGASAPVAVRRTCLETAGTFEKLADPYLQERAQDVRSMERLLLRALGGLTLEVSLPEDEHVLIGAELDAATAAAMRPGVTACVVTSSPGTNGHGAIIAKALGVPLLSGCPDAEHVQPASRITVHPDGTVEQH